MTPSTKRKLKGQRDLLARELESLKQRQSKFRSGTPPYQHLARKIEDVLRKKADVEFYLGC